MRRGIELHARCPAGGLPSVSADVQRLRDSIFNLVDNAIRYTNEGGVEMSVDHQDENVVVSVARERESMRGGEGAFR